MKETNDRPAGRPAPTFETVQCVRCDVQPVRVKLEFWTEDHGKTYVQDTLQNMADVDLMCSDCVDARIAFEERSRSYMADVPPSDFDPSFCGEVWRDDI